MFDSDTVYQTWSECSEWEILTSECSIDSLVTCLFMHRTDWWIPAHATDV